MTPLHIPPPPITWNLARDADRAALRRLLRPTIWQRVAAWFEGWVR